MKIYKNSGNGKILPLLVGIFIAIAMLLLTAIAGTALCYKTNDPLGNSYMFALGSMLIAGAVSGFLNSKRKNGSLGLSVIVSVTLGAFIMIGGFLMTDARISAAAMNALCYILISCGAAFLGKPRARKRKRRTS